MAKENELSPSKKTTKNRIAYIDYCKFIGMYLMILGHRPVPQYFHNVVFDFRVSLFFILSGFLFSFKKYPRYKDFVAHRFKQLIIPYFALNFIVYLIWLYTNPRFGSDIAKAIPYYKPFIGIFYGNGIDNYLQHCVPIWFLPCLFMVENIYYLCFRKLNYKWLGLLAMMVLGFVDYYFSLPRLPWGINLALTGILFYGMGNISKSFITAYINQPWWKLTLLAIVLISAHLFISYFNGDISMNYRMYGHYFLFIITGFTGAFFLISVSRVLDIFFQKKWLVQYIAQNTIVIVAFHNVVAGVMKGVLTVGLKMDTEIFTNDIWRNAIFSVVSLFLSIPIIYILNTYFPYLLGRSNKTALKAVTPTDVPAHA